MPKIKKGSRRHFELVKKAALKKKKFKLFIKVDFLLYKRKNKLAPQLRTYQTLYEPPFDSY